MAHKEQVDFCLKVKEKFPQFFKNKIVVDIGSLDINGNNRYLFEDCLYIGVDIGAGRNVDFVSKGHEFKLPDESVDVIISTECFEHDMYYAETLRNIYRMLKPGGFLIFACATTGRPEHGTRRTSPKDAPLLSDSDNWSDYYKNLTSVDIDNVLAVDKIFSSFNFSVNNYSHDLYFYGVKKGENIERTDYSFLICPTTQHMHKLFKSYSKLYISSGIGDKSAMAVKAIIGDVNDFATPDKLAAYVGLVPRVNNSNETVCHGMITKRGNKLIRKLLVQCTWVSIRYNPVLKEFYSVLKKKKPAGKAIIAVARKLVYQIFYTLKHNWYFTNTENTEKEIKVF